MKLTLVTVALISLFVICSSKAPFENVDEVNLSASKSGARQARDPIKCGQGVGSCPSIDGDAQGKRMCCNSINNDCGTGDSYCNIALGCNKVYGSCY